MRASTSASQACGSTSLSFAVTISCTWRRRAGRRDRSRRRATTFGRGQSRSHSAHVGQEVVVHYRWHPLYGRRVRRIQGERRASGEFVHVELAPGVVTIVAAWMLDPVAALA